MKTPTASSATSSQREQTSLLSQMPRSPRSNVCSTPDPENPSVSVHPKRFSTPSLTLKFLCAGKLNPREEIEPFKDGDVGSQSDRERRQQDVPPDHPTPLHAGKQDWIEVHAMVSIGDREVR